MDGQGLPCSTCPDPKAGLGLVSGGQSAERPARHHVDVHCGVLEEVHLSVPLMAASGLTHSCAIGFVQGTPRHGCSGGSVYGTTGQQIGEQCPRGTATDNNRFAFHSRMISRPLTKSYSSAAWPMHEVRRLEGSRPAHGPGDGPILPLAAHRPVRRCVWPGNRGMLGNVVIERCCCTVQ